jgi:hypothetical protein
MSIIKRCFTGDSRYDQLENSNGGIPFKMTRIAEQLGPELYVACSQNDVIRVEALTSTNPTNWSAAVIAAASNEAGAVVTYCLRARSCNGVLDAALRCILEDEELDPAYRFLDEANFVNVNHCIEGTGSMLGVLAGESNNKRHSLMQYMLEKGANPNERVDIEDNMFALTAAAGHSDRKIVELLLDYGAQISGSGALTLAAERGNVDNVECLLGRGADVNEMVSLNTSRNGHENMGCPLHKAVENGHATVVDILLNAGADVSIRDAKGRTAADIAAQGGLGRGDELSS